MNLKEAKNVNYSGFRRKIGKRPGKNTRNEVSTDYSL